MKIGIIGDIHFSEYSSILRSRGYKFSTRLENCIESINWAENETCKCDLVVYLGDFFDKSNLNAEEITALNYVSFNDVPHKFLVGNHEMGINSLIFSSAHIFGTFESSSVISEPSIFECDDVELCYLPYMLEEDRKPLKEIFKKDKSHKRIIFSHNDISGIQMGQFISKSGFTIKEIESNCDYFFNGHLHNGAPVTDKIINVGNLTGQNFSEDGFKYTHNIFIFDTDTMSYEVHRNPFAINFYKIDSLDDIEKTSGGVVTIKVKQEDVDKAKELIEKYQPVAHRLIIDYNSSKTSEVDEKSLSVDHLAEFIKFIHTRLDGQVDPDLLEEEVSCIYD